MLRAFYLFLKKIQLDRLYSATKFFLPKKITRWISSLGAKYDPPPLVLLDEIRPQFKKACAYLQENASREELGDYLEFGVCHGTSLHCMYETLSTFNFDKTRLFGFDSFEGLPPSAAEESDNDWQPGEFASSLEYTSGNLTRKGIDWSRTFLVKGWYSETLTNALIEKHNIKKASLIMIDCDLYSSSKESLAFCRPLIKDVSIVFFDDWIDGAVGEKKAWKEFLEENPQFSAQELGTYKPRGKIFIVKNNKA